MIKLSEVISEIIKLNQVLQFGMFAGLFNLTALAQFIKPQVEVRLKREVSVSTILMALSRLKQNFDVQSTFVPKFKVSNITVTSNLCLVSIYKTEKNHIFLADFYAKLLKSKSYINMTEGLSEITLIFENILKNKQSILEYIEDDAKMVKENLSAIVLKFPQEYLDTPGYLFAIMQSLFIQNINLVEISSSYTEVIFYVEEREAKLAFDTLFQFLK